MTSSGGFCYLVFKSGTNTWTVPSGVTSSSILLIAGGGAGGSGAWGGGGGAGGVVYDASYALTSGSTYSLSIGAGGSGGAATLSKSTNTSSSGSDSWLFSDSSLVAKGGGAGASYAYGQSAGVLCSGRNGGSGGGSTECADGSVNTGGSSNQTVPAGADSAYGFAGGSTPNAAYYAGAGGGGAGQVGTSVAAASAPGKGGNGTNAFSSWLTIINSSMTDLSGWSTATASGFIAGGGGGASKATPGAGGSGGGGAGGTDASNATLNGTAGTPGTGSGGGGGTHNGSNGVGGAGGSGLLIIKYQVPDVTAPSFTNSTTFSLSENSVVATNAATITLNESATVTINSGNDSALFSVVTSDSTTARIRFLTSPNFESPTDVGANNTYDISVRATDTAGNFANQSIAITITNVNEAPSITNSSSSATASLSQAENITSVATYAAIDPDAGAILRFTISGTDAAVFSIDSVTGVIAFAINPDFEAPLDSDVNNTYIVIITVSDGALTDTQTVTVTITNANELPTIGAPTFSGSTIKGVSVTISITSNVAGKARFFVNGKRIPTCLSRSTSGSYPNFTVTCSWKPPVTGRQSVNATFTPTDGSFSVAISPMSAIQVLKRGTTR
ncbi:unannotated protein [freshwater metagenome]|uniref:Unannotated protein n=1 Tax=freshwater metagenome TaxID=449393 RepID=A0A6J6GGN8_9ZZZZ